MSDMLSSAFRRSAAVMRTGDADKDAVEEAELGEAELGAALVEGAGLTAAVVTGAAGVPPAPDDEPPPHPVRQAIDIASATGALRAVHLQCVMRRLSSRLGRGRPWA